MEPSAKRKRTDEAPGASGSEQADEGLGEGLGEGGSVEQAEALLADENSTELIPVTRQLLKNLLLSTREKKSSAEELMAEELRDTKTQLCILKRQQEELKEESKAKIDELDAKLAELTEKRAHIPASALTPIGAINAFKLTQVEHHFETVELVEPPDWVVKHHERIKKATLFRSTTGEAYARLLIDPVIIAALLWQEERAITLAQRQGTAPPVPLRLVMEERLEAKVSIKGEKVTIHGKADYAIYYGPDTGMFKDSEPDRYEAGIVAIEAKRSAAVEDAMAQLIAYMGTIHQERKRRGKEHCTVWGFASDGKQYIWTRIDENGAFRRSEPEVFTERGRSGIFGTLCHMLGAAALSSPTTSPIKDPASRQKILARFRSAEHAGQFDFGLSKEYFSD